MSRDCASSNQERQLWFDEVSLVGWTVPSVFTCMYIFAYFLVYFSRALDASVCQCNCPCLTRKSFSITCVDIHTYVGNYFIFGCIFYTPTCYPVSLLFQPPNLVKFWEIYLPISRILKLQIPWCGGAYSAP